MLCLRACAPAVSRHRRLMALYDKRPQLQNDVFVAPNASVIGQVSIGPKSTVWYGSVLRGTHLGHERTRERACVGAVAMWR